LKTFSITHKPALNLTSQNPRKWKEKNKETISNTPKEKRTRRRRGIRLL